MTRLPVSWRAGMLAGNPEHQAHPGELERQIRAVVDGLSYLPTTASVALRFIELGRNPDADPADYARIVESDGSLSSKMLALANSSWFGVRNKVTKVRGGGQPAWPRHGADPRLVLLCGRSA